MCFTSTYFLMETFVSRIIEGRIIKLLFFFFSKLLGLFYLRYDIVSVPLGWPKYIPSCFVKITILRVGNHSARMVNSCLHTFQSKVCKHHVEGTSQCPPSRAKLWNPQYNPHLVNPHSDFSATIFKFIFALSFIPVESHCYPSLWSVNITRGVWSDSSFR